MFWITYIQPAPHAADQTCSCCLSPQGFPPLPNCCTMVCSLGLVKNHQQVINVGLLCTTSLQWHIYVWLSLPLLHTPCVCFKRPSLATAGREPSGASAPSLSALLYLLRGTVCLSWKHSHRPHWHSSKAHWWHQLTEAGEQLAWYWHLISKQTYFFRLPMSEFGYSCFVKPFCCGCSLKDG